MSERLLNVLVIEDNDDDYKLMVRELKKEGLQVDARRVDKAESLILALTEKEWDIVISDNNIPDKRVSVRSSLSLSRRVNPEIPFIIVSGTMGEENAASLMKQGANDYILKDNMVRLGSAVRREMADQASRQMKAEAERKLHESQERYRQLAESISDMFFALDTDFTITFWNQAAEKITKVTSSDAVGRSLFDLFPSIRNTPLQEKYVTAVKTQETSTFELEYALQGQSRYFMVTIYPSRDMITVMVRDTTASKDLQRKISSVNEELETFIYRVSHDIRGPLASIQGLVNLNQSGMLTEQSGELFARIGQMTLRLEDVVRSLQTIVSIRQESVAIADSSLHSIVGDARKEIHANDAEIHIEAGVDRLRTDPKLLGLAVRNMITNAIDFKHPTRKPVLRIRFAERDGNCEIAIADNGIGIPEDVQDKIFRMFFRGSLQSTGSGLGLYLAMSAVEKLGGTITVKSAIDEGSLFTIILPSRYPDLPIPKDSTSVESYRIEYSG